MYVIIFCNIARANIAYNYQGQITLEGWSVCISVVRYTVTFTDLLPF